jgi:hypothetical protein
MQISGVSLALTWPCRLCLLRVLCAMPLLQAFPFPSTLGEVTLHPLSQACVFIYSSHGKWVSPLSCGVFLPLLLLHALLLLVAGHTPPLPPWLVYLQFWDGFPPLPSVLRAPHPLCHVSLLFLLLITQFLFFFPGWGSVCPGGYADLAQGCLWEYRVLLRSPCGPYLPKPSGCWRLAAWEPSWFLCST